jgi:hypothetical protein
VNDKKPPLASWKLVTRSKCKEWGGGGIITFKFQIPALFMKNLHKFFMKANLPWVQLIWAKYYSNIKLLGLVMKRDLFSGGVFYDY